MSESSPALRKAYRIHMRSEWRGLSIFTVVLYVVTFSGAALLTAVDSFTGALFFNVHHSADESPMVIAYFWANLIATIYLIALAVLYIFGGLPRISFHSTPKNGNDKT